MAAAQRIARENEQRVELGVKLFRAAEKHTLEQRRLVEQMRQEQDRLKKEVQEDVARTLHAYDQWVGQIDENFTRALQQLETRIDQLQTNWESTQQRIEQMLKRSESVLGESRDLLRRGAAAKPTLETHPQAPVAPAPAVRQPAAPVAKTPAPAQPAEPNLDTLIGKSAFTPPSKPVKAAAPAPVMPAPAPVAAQPQPPIAPAPVSAPLSAPQAQMPLPAPGVDATPPASAPAPAPAPQAGGEVPATPIVPPHMYRELLERLRQQSAGTNTQN